jgi:hypothetical protein
VTWNKMPKSQMETSESWRPKSVWMLKLKLKALLL